MMPIDAALIVAVHKRLEGSVDLRGGLKTIYFLKQKSDDFEAASALCARMHLAKSCTELNVSTAADRSENCFTIPECLITRSFAMLVREIMMMYCAELMVFDQQSIRHPSATPEMRA